MDAVADDGLVRLLAAAGALAEQDARTADRQLEAFAAQGLDDDAELELAAAGDLEAVIVGRGSDADRDIALGLALQALADDPALHLVAVAARIRAVVDGEAHRQRRRVDLTRVERRRHGGIGDGVGDGGFHQAGDGDDIAGFGALDRNALEPAEGEDLGRAALFHHGAVDVERLDWRVDVEAPAFDAASEDPAEERVAIEQSREHPERAGVDLWPRHVADDRLEQRREIAVANIVGEPGIAGAAARVERREIELLVIGLEVEEQLEHLVEHLGGARVGAVDLVDDDDRLQSQGQGRAGDELGLRHRAFGRVDQQDHAIDHGENALDLGSEIGVAGRVDDVDARCRPLAVPLNARALGEDGDSPLLLEVVRVHRPLLDALVVAEGAGLAEELVNEGRLPVVDVRDDRHVPEVHRIFLKFASGARSGKPPLLQCNMGPDEPFASRPRSRAPGFRSRARPRAARCAQAARASPGGWSFRPSACRADRARRR